MGGPLQPRGVLDVTSMFNTAGKALLATLFAGMAGTAFAADLPEPPVVEAPAPVYQDQPADFGGWYIRGDLDYHKSSFRGADYTTYGVDDCDT